jgi:hypothetical protein
MACLKRSKEVMVDGVEATLVSISGVQVRGVAVECLKV